MTSGLWQILLVQVSFRQPSINQSEQDATVLIKVRCFPLYSLLLAYNATTIDFLSLSAEKAEFQVCISHNCR